MVERVKKLGANRSTESSVKGGLVKRDSVTGRFIAVQTDKGTFRSGPTTQTVVKDKSAKRHEALKRLADR